MPPDAGLGDAAAGLQTTVRYPRFLVAYHHGRDRVVSRTDAEFCAVVDVILGVGILIAI